MDVILYGSFAKNRATQDSDIDIAVVLRGQVDGSKEIDRIHDAIYHLSSEYGELVSVSPLTEEEVENTGWPIFYHIRNEGVKI